MPNHNVPSGFDSDEEDFELEAPVHSGRPGYYELLAREEYGWPSANLPDGLAADLADELYDVPDPRLVNDD